MASFSAICADSALWSPSGSFSSFSLRAAFSLLFSAVSSAMTLLSDLMLRDLMRSATSCSAIADFQLEMSTLPASRPARLRTAWKNSSNLSGVSHLAASAMSRTHCENITSSSGVVRSAEEPLDWSSWLRAFCMRE